jgi:hypothetical protein
MNFLNPFVLFGLAAASIPVLLHLLNLRRLKTVDFSTLRFLQALRESRVRALKIQQILLLVLRTLLIIFAVLAFARPTIPTTLPLLGVDAKASVVLLIDNSASMEAADQRGSRFRQAQAAARSIIAALKDGDEVAILPLAGDVSQRAVSFTRTFSVALSQIDQLQIADGRADIGRALRSTESLLDNASHVRQDVMLITDGQRNIIDRDDSDTGFIIRRDVSMLIPTIGEGNKGLERNCSVDSVVVRTALVQPDKAVEVESWVRNGSSTDASGLTVWLSYNGVRVAQRSIDVPRGETRSVILSAPPRVRGSIAVSVEIEDDAIDRDNVRYAGLVVPALASVAIVGPDESSRFVNVTFGLRKADPSIPPSTAFPSMADAVRQLGQFDVVYLAGGAIRPSEASALMQYVTGGGTVVVFATEDAGTVDFIEAAGIRVGPMTYASDDRPMAIRQLDRTHPVFAGVFASPTGSDAAGRQLPSIRRQRTVDGASMIIESTLGGFMVEQAVGSGRIVAFGVAPTSEWSSFPGSGLFPATMVRLALYSMSTVLSQSAVAIGERIQVPVPPSLAGRSDISVIDATGVTSPAAVVESANGSVIVVPPQPAAGVVRVVTADSVPLAAIAVNAPSTESRLDYLEPEALRDAAGRLLENGDQAVLLDPTKPLGAEVQRARTGSELWPLCVVLALLCALAEMLVATFWARETA